MKILVACEYSGRVRRAFEKKGHEVLSCDFEPAEDDAKNHYQGDVRDVIDRGFDLMIAHPPCTRLTNSGVRWLHVPPRGFTKQEMWEDLEQACNFYLFLRDYPIPKKCIENPIMHKYARERVKIGHRQIVHPHWFGEPYFKATGLELIGLPDLIPTNELEVPKIGTFEHKKWSAIHRAPPGPDRWKYRSRTFNGIAESMASQWG